MVPPRYEQDDITGRQDGIENIPGDEAWGVGFEAQPLRDIVRTDFINPFRRPLRVDQGYSGAFADFRFVQPLLVQGIAVRGPCVLRQLADPQMVVEENLR